MMHNPSAVSPQPDRAEVPLLGMVMSLCDTMDLVNPVLVNHHMQAAYLARGLAEAMGMPDWQVSQLLLAGLLHDSGAFSLQQRLECLTFETDDVGHHAEMGFRLFRGYPPLAEPAQVIRFHHTRWDHGSSMEDQGKPVPLSSHVLHLADRIAVLCGKQDSILVRVPGILDSIRRQTGKMFAPEAVDALETLADRYHFWLDATSPSIRRIIEDLGRDLAVISDPIALKNVAGIVGRLIDFRSRFTSTHSAGVAAACGWLGRSMGLSDHTACMIETAGHLHDLGKLAIPLELLEKPGLFTTEDFSVMKVHPYHTFRVLCNVPQLGGIPAWAAFHHERLDGSGYPFCLGGKELELEARIVAVADVFTALCEDRPYRKGMSEKEVTRVMQDMALRSLLDGDVVSGLMRGFDELDLLRRSVQATAAAEYRMLWGDAVPPERACAADAHPFA